MSNVDSIYEKLLVEKLVKDDKAAFTFIFTRYYNDLVNYAFSFTHNLNAAEEIAEEIFVKLWENRKSLEIRQSLKAYLLASVRNSGIDYLRHKGIEFKYHELYLTNPEFSVEATDNYIMHSELEDHLAKALEIIPKAYSEVFKMNRFDALRYSEIAEKLGVSVRTIEVRIGKALSLLRAQLKDFLE